MKNKLKKFFKNRIFIFVLSGILFSTVTASAITYFDSKNVTYNNETSGLSSKNVQGAIDELYNVCTAEKVDVGGQEVITTTSGDGLYKDEYEEGRYIYKGKDVNNYITFNNETWRIVSIEPDKTIKIMRNAVLSDRTWDDTNSNNWSRPATLNTYLNGSYLTGTLNATAQSQIVAKDFSRGSVTYNDTSLSSSIEDENSKKWNGKVALITASEYIRSNSNQSSCGNMNQVYNSTTCKNTTWMFNYTYWWTSTRITGNTSGVFYVISPGSVGYTYANIAYITVRPSVYLSSDIKITGGDGSQNNPYQISL